MTEDAFTAAEPETAEPSVEDAATEVTSTGHPRVDAVLESLAGLEGTPAEEHVAVFERAHDTLRGALADAGDALPAQG